MGGVALPPWYLFGLRQPSPGISGLYGRFNGELQEGLCQEETSSDPVPVVSLCRPRPPQEALQHWQVVLIQSLIGSLLLSSGSWCTQNFVFALQEWGLCFLIPNWEA